jgi:diguanylate cyclase (GGDEF)-like protein
VLRQLRRALENGEPFEGRLVNYRRDGTPFDIEWRITPIHDTGGTLRHFLAIQRDVTRETEQLRELRRHADRDPLTGTLTRRGCEQALQRELARGHHYGVAVSLLRIDIDRLKAINEAHGVAAGDAVLRRAAALTDDRLRRTDSIGRWGGSECLAILPHAEEAEALDFADALLEDLRTTPFPHGQPATASVGVAEWRADDDAEDLLARAGQAADAARRLGRDRVERAD